MRFVGLDPSSMTGLVILDINGNIIDMMEITSKEKDPLRMIEIKDQVMEQLEYDDVIFIEGFSFNSKGRGIDFQFGLGWILRAELYEGNGIDNFGYTEVSPSSLKKFVTDNGNSSKENMILPIYKHWGFEHNSDNVRDAYVLAQMARCRLLLRRGDITLPKYQLKVLEGIK